MFSPFRHLTQENLCATMFIDREKVPAAAFRAAVFISTGYVCAVGLRTAYQDLLGRLRGLVGERFAAKRSVASR